MLVGIAATARDALTVRGTTWNVGLHRRWRTWTTGRRPHAWRWWTTSPALGRWPGRAAACGTGAKLSAAQPRGIALDIMLSEAGQPDPAGDDALAHAMRRSGRVVSPGAAEASQPDGTRIEGLPMSALIDASAALGHVEIEIDADGVARQAYLYAGLGSAHWPAIALALGNLDPEARREGA